MTQSSELAAADEAPDMFLDERCSTRLSEVFSPPVCGVVCASEGPDLSTCIRHIPTPSIAIRIGTKLGKGIISFNNPCHLCV